MPKTRETDEYLAPAMSASIAIKAIGEPPRIPLSMAGCWRLGAWRYEGSLVAQPCASNVNEYASPRLLRPVASGYAASMDALLQLLLRMALWLRKRPPRDHLLITVVVVVAVSAFCVGFEAMFGWPQWLTVERASRTFLMRP